MNSPDRPFSEVLKSIFGNLEDIVRSELKLAKAEVLEDAAKSIRDAAWFAIGLVAALFAVGFLLVAVFDALLFVVPNWAAALIIAAALGLISLVTLQVCAGKRKSTLEQRPSHSSDAPTKETISWAKQQAR